MLAGLDHFVWGTPDLETGCAEIEHLFGVKPEPGGSHSGLGTCNALLSLGSNIYLEIMAPDHPEPGSIGARLEALETPGLVTWVMRRTELAVVTQAAEQNSQVTPLGPMATDRVSPQGDRLSWELLFVTGHGHHGLVPFFIDWQRSAHPSASAPIGGRVEDVLVESTQAERLNKLYADLDIGLIGTPAARDALSARFSTKTGNTVLRSTAQSLTVLDM